MPRKPPIACSFRGCPNLVEPGTGGLCEEHKRDRHQHYNRSRTDKEYTKIYDSKRWQTARKQALYRDGGMCVMCNEPATLVDHIKEIKDGGDPYSLSNLQSLCFRCHSIKTQDENKKRK